MNKTNKEYLDKWANDMKEITGNPEGTIKNYICQAQLFSKYINKSFFEATRDDLKGFLATTKKASTKKNKQHMIKCLYNWLIQECGMPKEQSPFNEGSIKIQEEERLPKYLTKDQIERINVWLSKQIKEEEARWHFGKIKVINNIRQRERVHYDYNIYIAHRDRVVFNLLIATGMRSTEVLTLKVNNFDFENNCVTIIGKGNKERVVPFNLKYSTIIQKFLQRFNITEGYIFKGMDEGSRLSKSGLNGIIDKIEKGTGIQMNPHMTRHGYGVYFMNTPDKDGKYAKLEDLQAIMGHSDISTTQIYTHVGKERLKKEVHKFAPNF